MFLTHMVAQSLLNVAGTNNMKMKITLLALSSLSLSGCIATHSYVQKEVNTVQERLNQTNDKMFTLNLQVKTLQEQMKALPELARDAFVRALAAQKLAEGKFVYTATLSDNVASFKTGHYELNQFSKLYILGIVEKLRAENKNVYIEIQGHTDTHGSISYNKKLGLERAEAVRDYMASIGVPLNRMDVISYGKSKLVSTKDSENRRVVIQVMQ